MPRVQWKENMSVGVKSIDDQHKQLISIINGLEGPFDGSTDIEFNALLQLVDYAVEHFLHEEELMEACGYVGLEIHKEEHLVFSRKVLEFKRRYRKSGFIFGEDLLEFLVEWLVDHILSTDSKYSSCMIAANLE